MKLRWAALAVVLALSALMPCGADAQTGTQPPGQRRSGSVGSAYPNPFNPDTRFPFTVGDTTNCTGQRHQVTARIYNLLAQVVAIPRVEGGSSTVAGGEPIENLQLECGSYTAYWNGKYLNTNREAASSVYFYRVEVDGRPVGVGKVFLAK